MRSARRRRAHWLAGSVPRGAIEHSGQQPTGHQAKGEDAGVEREIGFEVVDKQPVDEKSERKQRPLILKDARPPGAINRLSQIGKKAEQEEGTGQPVGELGVQKVVMQVTELRL